MPAPHQSLFYSPDALPATQPTASNTEGNHNQSFKNAVLILKSLASTLSLTLAIKLLSLAVWLTDSNITLVVSTKLIYVKPG